MKITKLLRLGTTLMGVRGMRSTYRPKVGPFQLNTSAQNGLSSVSVGTGPARFRVWDRQGHTGLSSVDLPGPISWRPSRRNAKAQQERQPQPTGAPMTMNPNGFQHG